MNPKAKKGSLEGGGHQRLRGPSEPRIGLAIMIALIWLAASVWSIWYFFYMPLRPFAKHDALAAVEYVRLSGSASLPGGAGMVALHFEDPDCACTKYSRPHVLDLKNDYPAIRHISIQPGQEHGLTMTVPVEQWVTTSPSVGVVDESGYLRYYGAYNAGAVCGEGFDFFREAVAKIDTESTKAVADRNWKNLSAFGCFCDWPGFQGVDAQIVETAKLD